MLSAQQQPTPVAVPQTVVPQPESAEPPSQVRIEGFETAFEGEQLFEGHPDLGGTGGFEADRVSSVLDELPDVSPEAILGHHLAPRKHIKESTRPKAREPKRARRESPKEKLPVTSAVSTPTPRTSTATVSTPTPTISTHRHRGMPRQAAQQAEVLIQTATMKKSVAETYSERELEEDTVSSLGSDTESDESMKELEKRSKQLQKPKKSSTKPKSTKSKSKSKQRCDCCYLSAFGRRT